MKNLKIQAPEGYEIDYENSTKENIILKKIEKKRPLSVREIEGREWYISPMGGTRMDVVTTSKNLVSSKERAEAFLALIQLVELRDAWNNSVDQEWDDSGKKHVIFRHRGKMAGDYFSNTDFVLKFKTPELRDQFLAQFRDLIETAKELI